MSENETAALLHGGDAGSGNETLRRAGEFTVTQREEPFEGSRVGQLYMPFDDEVSRELGEDRGEFMERGVSHARHGAACVIAGHRAIHRPVADHPEGGA